MSSCNTIYAARAAVLSPASQARAARSSRAKGANAPLRSMIGVNRAFN